MPLHGTARHPLLHCVERLAYSGGWRIDLGAMESSGILTIDNLPERLPPWHPEDDSHVYAIVDMGSNGIRFSITSLAPSKARLLEPIYSTRAAISLFDALTPDDHGALILPSATISDVAIALQNFARLADLHQVPRRNMMIFATEAMRRASNATELLAAVVKATGGCGVQILEPAVETLFGAVMGSRSAVTTVDRGALFLDLGGGSVQITWVDTSLAAYETKAALAGCSMPYGAAKLTRILEEGDAELQSFESNRLLESMKSAYDQLCAKFTKLQDIRRAYDSGNKKACLDVYMCGGGFRGYGSMLMHADKHQPYPIPSIGTFTVDGATFKQVDEMIRINKEHDGKIFGLSKRRRRQFDAITRVVKAFIATVPNINRATFCQGSNRDGALMMKLPREIRESNPLVAIAAVSAQEKPIFDGILRKISQALPQEVLASSNIPTVLSDEGLGCLYVREIWARGGYYADTNASYALHNAISRDSDAPGLTHLSRALLGLTVAARWGLGLGPADAKLAEGLEGIISRNSNDAVFWAKYIGAVTDVAASIFPVIPRDIDQFEKSLRYNPLESESLTLL
ncbi:Retrograde regulation protein-like protein [Emericellopsis cladophorae]|uniref:Retrograde regulation protein-like protein n=1 Tax=Emericellopsis cladophorae TaxID=2686198 RepID=A0A9Q0BHJ7_9HYPO|nr:Retrograde regulation protein-like protein [Emericellopsis cladophorae]KAI6785617.1 Retrograde regulation protein-like protein [Emericellopsis cladophorae]